VEREGEGAVSFFRVEWLLLLLDFDAVGTHFSCLSVTEKIAWEREDLAFISVDPVARLSVPICKCLNA
jgi:hypothetical protein